MQTPPADWKPRHDMFHEPPPHWLWSCTATCIPFFRKMLVFVWRSVLSASTWAVSVPSSVHNPLNLAKC